jgi:hypothetical protein
MCLAVYLAADKPLRLVPWDEAAPRFHTCRLGPDEERVKCQFAKPHLTYAGSYEGCGCGFQLGEYPAELLDPDELALRRESLRELAAFLREELPRVGPIQLFACWEGDQEAPPEHRRALTPADIEGERFFFLQKEISTVGADATPSDPLAPVRQGEG